MESDFQNLPIDIHYNKLHDWLVSRRHCKDDWHETNARLSKEGARLLVRAHEFSFFQETQYADSFSYEQLTNIIQSLRMLETSEVTLSKDRRSALSKLIKEFNNLQKAFFKDSVFIAALGQVIAQNVNYEIPFLKKQLERARKTNSDQLRKQADCKTQSRIFREKYSSSCAALGIAGDDVERELLALTASLPSHWQRVAASMRELAPVLAFYEQYEAFVRDGGGAADATPSGSSLSCVKTTSRFALLTHLLARGNTTVFELLRGHVPSRIESLVPQPTTPAAVPPTAAPPKGEQSTANSAADEIVWDIDSDTSTTKSAPAVLGAEAEIDFNIESSGGIDTGDALDIQVVDIGTSEVASNATGIVDGASSDSSSAEREAGDVARGAEAMRVFESASHRSALVNELTELFTLLHQRRAQLLASGSSSSSAGSSGGSGGGGSDVLLTLQLQAMPEQLHRDACDRATLDRWLALVDRALFDLQRDPRTKQLVRIADSPAYLKRFAAELKEPAEIAEKQSAQSEHASVMASEAADEQIRLEPRISEISAHTLRLKKTLQDEISKLYKGRPVNIVGEINNL